jgi:hypothetical protein
MFQIRPEIYMNDREKLRRPQKEYRVQLDPMNCGETGISYDTLEALAESLGVSEERVIYMALLDFAIKEIPGFDPDAPFLTSVQIEFLHRRREELERQKEADKNLPPINQSIIALLRVQGETDERPEDPGSENRGPA